jgi:hypothetical protein
MITHRPLVRPYRHCIAPFQTSFDDSLTVYFMSPSTDVRTSVTFWKLRWFYNDETFCALEAGRSVDDDRYAWNQASSYFNNVIWLSPLSVRFFALCSVVLFLKGAIMYSIIHLLNWTGYTIFIYYTVRSEVKSLKLKAIPHILLFSFRSLFIDHLT